MTVIANDYVEVTPYTTTTVALGVGQRADVLVKGIGAKGSAYYMRSSIAACSLNDGKSTEALAAIYYEGADVTKLPTTKATDATYLSTSPFTCGNDPLSTTVPVYPISAPSPATTKELDITLSSNGTNMLYEVNQSPFRDNYNDPILADVQANKMTFDKSRNVYNFGSNSSVRMVVCNYDAAPHPIHMHGHNMQVLQLGIGKWDGSITRSNNPQRRDVQVMPPGSTGTPSYVVVQWNQDNPGVWAFHCHFGW